MCLDPQKFRHSLDVSSELVVAHNHSYCPPKNGKGSTHYSARAFHGFPADSGIMFPITHPIFRDILEVSYHPIFHC